MTDVVVLLPGITGSVLRDSAGRDVWAPTAGAAARALVTLGRSITDLELRDGDADDGVTAPLMVPDLHLIPGSVARRRYGSQPPRQLELRDADLVLSGEGSLAAAPTEIAVLDGLLRGQGLAPQRIGDLPGLLRAFRRGDLGLLHFSCHNAFARGAPNASRILLADQPFEPVFLEQYAGRFAYPLVFLNACRTDGQAPPYTTVEGWAASFLQAGAGAFIGSLWEVTDTSASAYAQQFYQAALSGHTLGQAARLARDARPRLFRILAYSTGAALPVARRRSHAVSALRRTRTPPPGSRTTAGPAPCRRQR